jgi:hypothetical protein
MRIRLPWALKAKLGAMMVAVAAMPTGVGAQQSADAYASEEARELVRLARERRLSVDRRVSSYETTARERISVRLGVGIGEKLVYRRETATGIEWQRDGPLRLNVLGMREVSPFFDVDPTVPFDISAELLRLAFDPAHPERMLESSPDDTAWRRNPLSAGGEAHYRFAAGDTQVIRLPNGTSIRLLELRFEPRRSDPSLLRGSYWLEAGTHAVVRAYFTLARAYDTDLDGGLGAGGRRRVEAATAPLPTRHITAADLTGFLKRFRADVDFVAIEYGLWDLEWWLPRRVVAQGIVEVNGFQIPVAHERAYDDYTVRGDPDLAVGTDTLPERCLPEVRYAGSAEYPASDSTVQARTDFERARREAWMRASRAARGDTVDIPACVREVIIAVRHDSALVASPELPATIYASDIEIMSEVERRALLEGVAAISGAPWQLAPPRLQGPWQDPGLMRYNRVEALSLGGRMVFDLGAATLNAEARFGTGDLAARGEVALVRDGAEVHTRIAAYRRLPSVLSSSIPHGATASLGALFLGRDDGEYYDARGADIVVRPPEARGQWYDLRLYVERQRAADRSTHHSLAHLIDGEHRFRENFTAEAADQLGARLRLRAALGLSPRAPRIAGELSIGAEAGDYYLVRPEVRLQAKLPLPADWNVVVEGAMGTVEGADVPTQSLWRLSGSATLRGYPGGALVGQRYWRGRGEVGWGVTGARLVLFSDVAWAGPRNRFDGRGALLSAGLGVGLLDGMLRLDLARGLRSPGGWRVHIHFNAF